jgi:flavin reductase (DIM6/NTAB) family NADH-FMN oxidoreductase RutF
VGLETLPSKRVSPPRIAAAIGWVEATLEREVTDERYALIVGRILCSEINDRYLEDGRLKELPLTLLTPHFRMLGDVMADREELESEFTL